MDYASCLTCPDVCLVSPACCSVSGVLPAEGDSIGIVQRKQTAQCSMGPDQMHSAGPCKHVFTPTACCRGSWNLLPASSGQGPWTRHLPSLLHCLQDLPGEGHSAVCMPVQVLPLYCFDPRSFGTTPFGNPKTGSLRAKFLLDSVQDLKANLRYNYPLSLAFCSVTCCPATH